MEEKTPTPAIEAEEPQRTERRIGITPELAQKLLNYMSEKPLKEVAQLYNELYNSPTIEVPVND